MSVDFCDARQGGGAYGKTPATRPFYGSWPFAGLEAVPDGRHLPAWTAWPATRASRCRRKREES
ncbi:hypothetical protein CLD22_27965 [Rubrivivax gelatinosus]|nr:hypothetical protein [Rubrivivax gelatinosus]MBK1730190.1 hypothetical protein [Halorhodospira halophila]MBZ8135518.1 hypothetical protein [Afifella sp. IM 167]MBZ8143649.1 hypothetical protein [Rubrivivax gelatinosus]